MVSYGSSENGTQSEELCLIASLIVIRLTKKLFPVKIKILETIRQV